MKKARAVSYRRTADEDRGWPRTARRESDPGRTAGGREERRLTRIVATQRRRQRSRINDESQCRIENGFVADTGVMGEIFTIRIRRVVVTVGLAGLINLVGLHSQILLIVDSGLGSASDFCQQTLHFQHLLLLHLKFQRCRVDAGLVRQHPCKYLHGQQTDQQEGKQTLHRGFQTINRKIIPRVRSDAGIPLIYQGLSQKNQSKSPRLVLAQNQYDYALQWPSI